MRESKGRRMLKRAERDLDQMVLRINIFSNTDPKLDSLDDKTFRTLKLSI